MKLFHTYRHSSISITCIRRVVLNSPNIGPFRRPRMMPGYFKQIIHPWPLALGLVATVRLERYCVFLAKPSGENWRTDRCNKRHISISYNLFLSNTPQFVGQNDGRRGQISEQGRKRIYLAPISAMYKRQTMVNIIPQVACIVA